MHVSEVYSRFPRFWFHLFSLSLVIATFALAVQFHAAGNHAAMVATYSHGILRLTVPYDAEPGTGNLIAEVLDPEDHVLGRVAAVEVAERRGSWQQTVKLDRPLPLDELVWQRVHYRFEYNDERHAALEGMESLSQIIRTPVIHILGQQSYLAGGEAAVRVIVSDANNAVIPGRGSVDIELLIPDKKPRLLFTGPLNHRGTTEAQFRFPARLTGSYQLHYAVDTSVGSTEFTQAVRLEDKVSILLTTEKPIYQPGQTIHVRALALDRSNHEAVAQRKLIFELEDSRGNKVFRKATQTDKFGVASAEFGLADEVNLGTYHLRSLMGDVESPSNTAEIAVNVERYVLPKFKVAMDFGGNKAKHGYRPGDHVTGTVRANYFFGKPVDDAEITIKASSIDLATFDITSNRGTTDGEGNYEFDLRLPNYFVGRPLDHGAARVLVEATVKDSAGHSETRGEPITVSDSPLLITAVPEAGTLIPNLVNQVFILTSYPDGTPAKAELTVHVKESSDVRAVSDEGGVAVIPIRATRGLETLAVEATDREGNHASNTVWLQSREGEDQILLRAERAVYRAGDHIQLRVFSTKQRGTAYLDVVKEGQTVLTRDVEIDHGQASVSLAATPDLAGTVDLNVYVFGRDALPVGDHRLVFIQPADELRIEAAAENAAYKPGDDARIRFRVTNARGEGVSAALGLQVVDEAVFALAEKQPGFAKVFFYLEREVMKPRYEIHSIGMEQIVEPADKPVAEQRDRAARALFSATEVVRPQNLQTEFGRAVPMTRYAEYATRYQKHFAEETRVVAQRLASACAQNPSEGDLTRVIAKLSSEGGPQFRDAWGTRLRIEPVRWERKRMHYLVRNAGPDKQFDTADDLNASLEVRRRKVAGGPTSRPSAIETSIEHDHGPFNGRAEIVGSILDQWGGALEGVRITVRDTASGKSRSTSTNANGEFSLSAISAGDYKITATSGSDSLTTDVKLDPRDQARLSVHFRNQTTTTVTASNGPIEIEVTAEAAPRFVDGLRGGVAGRLMGGVLGGIVAARELPVPAMAPRMMAVNSALVMADQKKDQSAASVARVRSYFPEALYINPEIITDKDGLASITIPVADSITTWRMAMLASTPRGALGTATSSLKVFQDFFVDLDLPVKLTQGDRVSIPVAVYNYSGTRGDVGLKLHAAEWFSLVDDAPEKSVSVEASRVTGSQFTLEAKRIGKFKLSLSANMQGGTGRADIVIREIEVVPNGREQSLVFNGQLEDRVQHQLNFPAAAIPEASKILIRLYPGPLSQVVEGMDSLLRMPFGCFEQTSSTTYPNVLALDYMRRTKKLTPEVHAKAEGYIGNGYQRLLTFEVPGGGFSWFGNAPANKILTSYGLMEFSDMSRVHDVDPRLIQRTQQWLAAQQQADGSWKPDASAINEGATNRYSTDVLRITAYIAWALENTGFKGPAIERARQFVESHMSAKMDAYTLAVIANFAIEYRNERNFARDAMQLLLKARNEMDQQVWWTAEETSVYATGPSASIETTGLAVQALLKWGEAAETTRKALSYIASKKDAAGTWGTTQATVMALRALLLSTEKGAADVRGTLEVFLNDRPAEKLILTSDNNDLLHQFVLTNVTSKTPNNVEIRFEGKGSIGYQMVGNYFLPWDEKSANEPLSIDVAYDRTHLSQDDVANATATIKNNLNKNANMIMVDLGIAPGFELLSEDLQAYLEKSKVLKSGRLEKFSLTATQAILYFDSFAAGETVTLCFRLRAKYPIRARTFQSRVYEYYDPQVHAVARPVQLEVRKL
jgi:hypothetical protein